MQHMSDEDYEEQVDDETPTVPATPSGGDDNEAPYPEPHPRFAAHFTDSIYSDWSDDLTPFGGDEASDVVAELYDEVDELDDDLTLRQLAEGAFGDEWPDILDDPDALHEFGDPVLIGLGFALIRITGTIDPDSRALLSAAIGRQSTRYKGEESFATMADDLERFES